MFAHPHAGRFAGPLALAALGLGLGLAPVARSATLSSVASLTGSGPNGTGETPDCRLAVDFAGNVYGTAVSGGPYGFGTVFKIAARTKKLTVLAAFSGPDGANPSGTLARDWRGNLFGTTSHGGSADHGTVFEVVAGSRTVTTLYDFNTRASGSNPLGGVTLDRRGNLYGTTVTAGAADGSGLGTVWEIPRRTHALTTLAVFNFTNGAYPTTDVTVDGQGNLFGTTSQGGAPADSYTAGTVWEIPRRTRTLITLASFPGLGPDGQLNDNMPSSGVTLDEDGNLFGTIASSRFHALGSVWEIDAGSGALTTFATFNRENGVMGSGDVTFDSRGNMFGTALGGDANGDGTVWEISRGSSTITTVAAFNFADGFLPYYGVTLDLRGNLFGTTYGGGAGPDSGGDGTVFEVSGAAAPGRCL